MHSKEPWRLEDQQGSWDLEPSKTPHDASGNPIIQTANSYEESYKPEISDADCARIVACVNACRGIPTEELQKVIDGKKHFEFADGAGRMRREMERGLPSGVGPPEYDALSAMLLNRQPESGK